VLGIAQHAAALRASGQHLKRGVLLHGPPGTGKTHVVRYLIGRLSGVTVVLLSGGSLARIRQACSVARALQPAVVVVEDVDLIAEQRGPHLGQHPLLFQLLNEMDGLGADANVTFLLTTSRADILEEALAARPGRVDHTVRLPLPDAAARRRLLRLSQGRLHIGRSGVNAVVARTDGVTASFIKELLRRAALHAAVQADGRGAAPSPRHAIAPAPGQAALNGHASGPAPPLRVTARHLNRALDELLDSRNDLTRVLLGSRPARGLDSLIREPPGRRAPAGSRPRAPLTAPWPDPPRAAEPTHPG
jgi:SpoVK/Ycf46/Vps4 family AAA+-type ATPase